MVKEEYKSIFLYGHNSIIFSFISTMWNVNEKVLRKFHLHNFIGTMWNYLMIIKLFKNEFQTQNAQYKGVVIDGFEI